MRRKTISPVLIGVILLALTASILCVTFYMQASSVKAIYGTDIRVAIYEVNTITEEVPTLLDEENYTELIKTAAKLEALKDAGLLHPEINNTRQSASAALYAYADALYDENYSEGAMNLLKEDAVKANKDLRLLVQHSINKLADVNVRKMDKAFFEAMNQGSKFHKEISLLAKES